MMVGQPPKTLEGAARIPVKLGFGEFGGVTGMYWANDSPASAEEGRCRVGDTS